MTMTAAPNGTLAEVPCECDKSAQREKRLQRAQIWFFTLSGAAALLTIILTFYNLARRNAA
jgi:hypothetical protein